MIDLHTHILPHLDDGSPDYESSLEMARLSLRSGVIGVAATPHCGIPGQTLDHRAESIIAQTELFQKKLLDNGLRLAICPGMEIFGTPETPSLLRSGQLLTLNRSRYPLLEFPFHNYGREATQILEGVLALGLRPLVAHPERYLYLQNSPHLINLWADMGCLFQINRGSLLGRFGPGAEALAFAMVERGFACAVASDGHTPHTRTTWMQDVRELLEGEFSPDTAAALLSGNPRLLLSDQEITLPEPNWF